MRLTCLVVALLLGTCLVCQGGEEPAAGCCCQNDPEQGFTSLFDGKTLDGWQGDTKGYQVDGGVIICQPGGNLFTAKEYADFIFRFEFKMPPMGNNGVGIRTPLKGNPAYAGMEIQILDDHYKEKHPQLKPYQFHGSIYGVVPAKPGHQKPIGEWNREEILCQGSHVRVTLNGTVIVDADLDKIEKTMDGHDHPGLHNEKGYIGFLGHGSRVEFRNLRIKELK
jgi:hypothetical protein